MDTDASAIRANMHWVTADLATGGDLPYIEDDAVQHIEDWVAQGITHVIDMRAEWSDEDLVLQHAPQIHYLHLPTNDAWGYKLPPEMFDKGVEFATHAIDYFGKVLAHCHMGVNRGPSMAFAILLAQDWDPVQAFDHIKRMRPQAFVAYALDALVADSRRRKRAGEAIDSQARYQRLAKHIKKVNDNDEVLRVNGIIHALRKAEGGTFYNR